MSRKPDILKAAIELFAAKGYHATSTHEIAERAELSEGIIFYYFKTKEHIMLGILEDVFEAYIIGIYDAMEKTDNGWDAIRAYLEFHFRMRRERSTEILCLARDYPSTITNSDSPYNGGVRLYFKRLLELVGSALRQGQEDGTIRDCPVEETAFLIVCTLASFPKFDIIGLAPYTDLDSATEEFIHRVLSPLT
ncbi:MAG: TetR/AcrR family transcriptional regulator [Desulfarculaceae bacterium]|nr:TetR/AcrR family transcriptional regulator [Desulfarculaceae bacterium]MCF8071142.1 TetR/AcrR family transcriptional regulator [Desulfarculaceae bacterium]MCF8101255.1 TetR/AcrR family transcriptional regulator [Desulfarculaceae bacterium]MCF8115196.1 TetR/AcrR family transcriptional regulator [Desulfarculaceae bacterium]